MNGLPYEYMRSFMYVCMSTFMHACMCVSLDGFCIAIFSKNQKMFVQLDWSQINTHVSNWQQGMEIISIPVKYYGLDVVTTVFWTN